MGGPARYNSLWHGLFSMVREEGIRSLWKGFGGGHTHTHTLTLSHTHTLSLSHTLSHTLTLTHSHTHTHRYNSLWHGLFSMVREEGIRSLWKGFGPVALLTAPAHGVYFGPTPLYYSPA